MLLRVGPLSALSVAAALFGFIVSVSLSIVLDHAAATATHCQVYNFFPSVSAAVGRFQPQTLIWQTSIVISCLLRVVNLYVQQEELRRCLRWDGFCPLGPVFIALHSAVNAAELIGLVGLSLVTSSTNFGIHSDCFILFLVSSFLFMLLHLYCFHDLVDKRQFPALSSTKRMKEVSAFLFAASIAAAAYLYTRHWQYCEPGMYSKFAIAEYVVILSNVAFHTATSCDLRRYTVHLPSGDIWRDGVLLTTDLEKGQRRTLLQRVMPSPRRWFGQDARLH